MTKETFVQKAVEGGWGNANIRMDEKYGLIESWTVEKDAASGSIGHGMTLYDWTAVWLDPKAWKAVGEAMQWPEAYRNCGAQHLHNCNCVHDAKVEGWKHRMTRMVSSLIEGKTLDEYIETL